MQTLFIRTFQLDTSETPLPDVRTLPLRRLEVSTHILSVLLPLLGWLDAERLPEILLLEGEPDAIPYLLRHLTPPLRVQADSGLALSLRDWDMHISVQSLVDGKTRVFERLLAEDLFQSLFPGALVSELSLSFEAIQDVVDGVQLFPAVRVLRIELPAGVYDADDADGLLMSEDGLEMGTSAGRAHIAANVMAEQDSPFPVLEELVLHAPAPGTSAFAANPISAMLSMLCSERQGAVKLTLQRVTLLGWDGGDLGFRCVSVA